MARARLDAVWALPGDDRDHGPGARDQRNLPAAAAGLAVNMALLFVLVPTAGSVLGIAGAGIALCGAYVAMVAVMHLLTRGVFAVDFQWRRLAQLDGDLRAAWRSRASCCCRRAGFAGLVLRVLWLAWSRLCCLLTRFFAPNELTQARLFLAGGRRAVSAFRARGG